jgi:hypothetical protein
MTTLDDFRTAKKQHGEDTVLLFVGRKHVQAFFNDALWLSKWGETFGESVKLETGDGAVATVPAKHASDILSWAKAMGVKAVSIGP